MRKVLLLGLLLLPGISWADAPFCTVSAAGTQCIYYDPGQCQQAARQFNGMCVANVQSAPTNSGAPFCVVSAAGSQCFYYDVTQCQQSARTSNGACVANPNAR